MARTRPANRRYALLVVAVASATTAVVLADFDLIAGYEPVSDVVPHSLLDLDMSDMEEGTDQNTEDGFAAAYSAYAVGGNR